MRPNIVVFVTDQHRADWLSCMGNQQIHTPNIDALAQEGVCFTRAYCNTPLCMPSRYTMWTGLQASAHGLRTNGVVIPDQLPTLPGILGKAGYKTISVGKIHLSPWHLSPQKSPNITQYDPQLYPECETIWENKLLTHLPEKYFGLDVTHFLGGHGGYCFGEYLNWLEQNHPKAYAQLKNRETAKPSTRNWDNYYSTMPKELYYNQWIQDKSIQELEQCSGDQPFFLWCSFPDPHFPFGPPAPYHSAVALQTLPKPIAWEDDRSGMNELYHKDYYTKRGMESLDGGPTSLTLEQILETKALALGMVKSVDDSVGQVMNYLRTSGKLENTIVVFVSDHGELMGDHGLYCKGPFHYEGLLKIPFIVRLPQAASKGVKSDAVVSLVDFMPTLLELAGVGYPGAAIPDWQGLKPEDDIYRDASYLPGKSLTPLLWGEQQTVQDGILIEDDDDVRGVFLRTLITQRYKLTVYAGKEYGELFDLETDPEERTNLWTLPQQQERKARLIRQLLDLMIQSQPRLHRRVGVA